MMPFEKIGKLYLVTGVTDLRKGIDGYAALIQLQLHQSPMDHSMYLFCNRDRTKLKCLYFDGTGFWLLYKRLEKGHFKWKKDDANHSVMISEQQLGWLLDGLKIEQKSAFQPVKKDYI